MEINGPYFVLGFISALAIICIFWLIYRFYKSFNKINDKLVDQNSKIFFVEYNVDNLRARMSKLEESVSILEKVDEYTRINNTPYNEEGIGSINPSEADTE